MTDKGNRHGRDLPRPGSPQSGVSRRRVATRSGLPLPPRHRIHRCGTASQSVTSSNASPELSIYICSSPDMLQTLIRAYICSRVQMINNRWWEVTCQMNRDGFLFRSDPCARRHWSASGLAGLLLSRQLDLLHNPPPALSPSFVFQQHIQDFHKSRHRSLTLSPSPKTGQKKQYCSYGRDSFI